jgi:hypothetical protein
MPSKEQVDRAIELLSRTANYQHFFEQLRSATWIEPLLERGFFRNPPEPIREGGYARVPVWVESQYLARVAPDAPDIVLKVLSDLPATENTRVHEDVVDAALVLPPASAVRLVSKLITFLDAPFHSLVPEKLAALVERLAQNGRVAPAVRLAHALLQPRIDEPREVSGYALPPDPRPRFRHPEYDELLHRSLDAISDVDPAAGFSLLLRLLEEALELTNPRQAAEDFSYIWYPAIEGGRRTHRDDMRVALVTAIRRAAESGALDPRWMLEHLESQPWPVFHRLAMHVLRVNLAVVPDLARRAVADTADLFEPSGYHERALLIREGFGLLDSDQRRGLLDAIERGPADEDADEEGARRRLYWSARMMTAIESELPGDALEALASMRRELALDADALAEPEFAFPASEGMWVGPTSPLTSEEILALSDADLLGRLATWEPGSGWRDPSREGLGLSLKEAAKREPNRFAHIAERLIDLDSTYARSAIDGWTEAARSGQPFEWSSILRLCDWVASQLDPHPTSKEQPDDPRWSWARRSVAALLSEGLTVSPRMIPLAHRSLVWEILVRLVEDPDPTPEHEDRYMETHLGAVAVAINSVRGEAMHAVIRYGLWVRHHELSEAESFDWGLDRTPELRDVLDRHLDLQIEPSLAVRSAYGQFAPWLHLLDVHWATTRLASIFPTEPEASAWFDAAWEAYVLYTQPFDSMIDVLRTVYSTAVARIGDAGSGFARAGRDPAENLAEHLAVFLARGVLALDDDLVDEFFTRAPDHIRGHLHAFLGRSFVNEPPPDDVAQRGQALWDRRLATMTGEADSVDETMSFGWWFAASTVDLSWRFANLHEVLRRTGGRIAVASFVFKELARVSDQRPQDALEALRLMIRGGDDEWNLSAATNEIMEILTSGLRSDPETTGLATSIANSLGARGYATYRALVDGPTAVTERD